jgi:GAF domain-containing protein
LYACLILPSEKQNITEFIKYLFRQVRSVRVVPVLDGGGGGGGRAHPLLNIAVHHSTERHKFPSTTVFLLLTISKVLYMYLQNNK